MVLGAILFVLAAVSSWWIRRSSMGRRLLAMKDSEAACATVGMNLTSTKLAVFSLSAGIAGLGGAYLGGVQTTTTSSDWSFTRGLPIFMLGVVGGIGRVGGALFAGMSFAALQDRADVAVVHVAVLALQHLVRQPREVTPGLMGIGLGRNPNGAAADIAQRLRADPEALACGDRGMCRGLGVSWVIAWRRHSGWDFIIGIVVVMLVARRARHGHRDASRARPPRRTSRSRRRSSGWASTAPFTLEDREVARSCSSAVPTSSRPDGA